MLVSFFLFFGFGDIVYFFFFFSSRRRHTRCSRDWSSDVCSSDLVETEVPKAGTVRTYGVVTEVASRHEGGRFESDTLRIAEEFTMDADKSRSATVQTIRVVPEIWVAPDPGEPAWRVSGAARDEALYADEME